MDLAIYMDQMDRVHLLLSREEECELARRSRNGDLEARDQLIASIMPLVIHIARKYEGRGLDLEDLIQHGNCGAMMAVDRFNPNKARLTTYATWWIRQEIRAAVFKEGRLIRIPIHVFAKDRMEQLSDDQKAVIRSLSNVRSLSGSRRDCGNGDWSEAEIAGRGESDLHEEVARLELLGRLDEMLATLNKRHRRILELRMAGQTLEKIGRQFGVCKERIRQIEADARESLRQSYRRNRKRRRRMFVA